MLEALILAVLAAPSHHYQVYYHHTPPIAYTGVTVHVVPCGCVGYVPVTGCGIISPHIYAGPIVTGPVILSGGPPVNAADVATWEAYLKELDGSARDDIADIWQKADNDGRRKLLGLLAKMRGDIKKRDEEDKKRDAEAKGLAEQKKKAGLPVDQARR